MAIIKECFKRPYVFWLIGIMLFYIAINVVISQFYITAQYIPYYFEQINWSSLILSATLSISIAFLVALNMVIGYIYYQRQMRATDGTGETKKICFGKATKTSTAITTFSSLGGFATGICSACTSVFPFLLSSSGITLTWTALPFKGLEIQGLLIILLIFNVYYINK